MQQPTCVGLRIRSTSDARIIFHAVSLGILHKISRRLDNDERRAISSGCVFVWEERGVSAESSLGIERWTDSIRWGPSRVRDGFLFYHEREPTPSKGTEEVTSDVLSSTMHRYQSYRWGNLIKQTYSVFIETPFGRKKWHIIAYFTQDTVDYLHTIDDDPQLATLSAPPGIYKSARSTNRSRSRLTEYPSHLTLPHRFSYDDDYCDPILAPNSRELAPLAYLKRLPPQPRHPVDEMAIMSFPFWLSKHASQLSY